MVNIKDIDTEAPEDGDWLQNIFNRQQELEDQYESIETANGFPSPPSRDLNDYGFQRYLKDAAYRIVEEISEATNCLKNKPWKQTPVITDEDHYFEEMADGFHFYIRWAIKSGLTAEDLYKLYFKKSEVNLFRQESNY
jgi:hypothetical protein